MAKTLADLGFGSEGKDYGDPASLDAVTLKMHGKNAPSLFDDNLNLLPHVAKSPGWTAWANHCLACAKLIAKRKAKVKA